MNALEVGELKNEAVRLSGFHKLFRLPFLAIRLSIEQFLSLVWAGVAWLGMVGGATPEKPLP
jgi:hypothetical protein